MRTVLVTSLAFALGASFTLAQQAPPTDLPVTEVAALGVLSPLPTDPAPSWPDRILTALGGAVLGAGLGYFASQVARGDWDNGPGPNGLNRPVWAAVGGSAGFAFGLSFPLSGRAEPTAAYERPSVGRSVLSIVEIWEVTVSDAYDAVRILRPEWLAERPPDIIGHPDSGAIRVYLDGFHLGGVRSLIGLSVDTIDSIRFISATVATARWGVGHSRGVIQVVTTTGLP